MINLFQTLKNLKGNHTIGVEIDKLDWSEIANYSDEELTRTVYVCDADSTAWKNGYIDDQTPDWLNDFINVLDPDYYSPMESLFEFSDAEKLVILIRFADEIRNG